MKDAKQRRIHTVWFNLYKILETENASVVTKGRSVVAWSSGWRQGRVGKRIAKGYKKTYERDENVHWDDYDHNFMDVDIFQDLHFNTLNMCKNIVAES